MRKYTENDLLYLTNVRRTAAALKLIQNFLWGFNTGSMIGSCVHRNWKMAIGYCIASMICMYGAQQAGALKKQMSQMIKDITNEKNR